MLTPANNTRRILRSVLILALGGTLMLLPMLALADPPAECETTCADDKQTRDTNCESFTDETEPSRPQCLLESQEIYEQCLTECPQPTPPDAIPPVPGN